MGDSLALLRLSAAFDVLALAFRRLADLVPAALPEPVLRQVPALDLCVDQPLAYASPAMPTRSFQRKERWVCPKMNWP